MGWSGLRGVSRGDREIRERVERSGERGRRGAGDRRQRAEAPPSSRNAFSPRKRKAEGGTSLPKASPWVGGEGQSLHRRSFGVAQPFAPFNNQSNPPVMKLALAAL